MIGPHRNHGARLREFSWRGLRCVSLENETLRALLCLDKGCDILELVHKPTDTETLHQAPAGPLPKGALLSSALAPGVFRDQFPGGWYVMIPNGPGPCTHRGADYGQHGEATFLPWDYAVEVDHVDEVAIRAWTRLRRTPLLVERRIALAANSGTLTIEESITNESPQPLEVLWGHHPTFGAPLLEPGTRIDMPSCRTATAPVPPPGASWDADAVGTWPDAGGGDLSEVPANTGNTQDFARLDGFERGWFAIRNPKRGAGIAMRWDEALFPLLGYWRVNGGGNDYPWYGARHMLALEPCCDLPSVAEAAARGTAIAIAPGARRETRIEASLFAADERAVTDVDWGGSMTLAGKE